MTTLPNMSIVLPTLGADIGTWDDKINDALTLVDAHDHKSGKGLRINTTAIEIDADLTIAGYALTNVGKAAFTAVTALSSGSQTFFVSSADNELYWRSNGGTNIKVTSGSTLNISLVGGIAGDYTSVGAEVAYDDSNDRYTFKQEGTKPWARIACGPVRIFEYNTLETVYVELAVDAALASSYTLTFPAALPASTFPIGVSSAGVLSYTGVFTGAITATDLKNSADQVITLSAAAFAAVAGGGTVTLESSPTRRVFAAAAELVVTFPLRVGDRANAVSFVYKGNGVADITVEVRVTSAAGIDTLIGSGSVTNPTSSWVNGLLSVTPTTLAAGEALTLSLYANATGIELGNITCTFTRP